jgi:galactokinase
MDIKGKFREQYGYSPHLVVRAPGRVNLLGEHTDYNDGPVLPAAIDRAVYLAVGPGKPSQIDLFAADISGEVSFNLDSLANKVATDGKPLPDWSLYPAGVAWALKNAGLQVSGVQVVYTSDIPIGAGLSSSAAVEVGFAVMWQTFGGWHIDTLKLAQYCQQAENEYVGLACGLMDQFASACGVKDHALYFDTRSLESQPVPLPTNSAMVIADSGIRRNLTSSAYNDRRFACDRAVEILQQNLPDIESLRDVPPTEFAAYSAYLPETVRKRAEHVIKEIQRVHSAVSAFHRQDKQAIGALMYAGHRSLRDLYEVSTPELDTLVDISRSLPGCIGARLTGAGFGGCTVNLVEAKQAENFITQLQDAYFQQTGRVAQVYLCQADQGARVIE